MLNNLYVTILAYFQCEFFSTYKCFATSKMLFEILWVENASFLYTWHWFLTFEYVVCGSEMDEICPKITLQNCTFKPFFLELCDSNVSKTCFILSFTSKSVQKDPTTIFFWQFFEISCLSFSLEWMLIGITETSEISTSTHFFSIWVLPINF